MIAKLEAQDVRLDYLQPRSNSQLRALAGIDRLHRLAGLLGLQRDVFGAVRHDGALAER